MEIDLHQLPIPGWGLHCPNCEYALQGLMQHRCPECGQPFDITKLVISSTRLRDPWYRGDELPVPAFGLQCRQCQQVLDGAETHTCPRCDADNSGQFTPPHRKWFLVTPNLCGRLTSPQLIGLLEEEYVPHYVVIESTGVYERGGGDPRSGGAGSRLFVSPEFYFDMLWLIERETRANLAAAQGPERACPQCREVNPPNFDICWKCGANLAGDT